MIFVTHTTTRLAKLGLLVSLHILVSVPHSLQAASESASTGSSGLVISAILTGTQQSSAQEFVTVFNNSNQAVNVTNVCLVYSSSSDITQTSLACISTTSQEIQFYLKPQGSLVFTSDEFNQAYPELKPYATFNAGIASTSGHIKLQSADKTNLDVVGWGNATKPEGQSIGYPAPGKMLQRKTDSSTFLQDSNNNSQDIFLANMSVPQQLVDSLFEEITEVEAIPLSQIFITELLPDADGADAGKEFIEFYNASDQPINLRNLKLQLGPSFSKSYQLPDITMLAHQYVALSDTQSGLTLPNTTASLRLIDTSGNVISQTGVYSDLGEGVVWALSSGSWYVSYMSTPGSENIVVSSKPCEPGQQRSIQTDRCVEVSGLIQAICKPDQERNSETGRCRKIMTVTATKCKTGQIINPETGRCKAVALITNSTKPCLAGQERNPETGRCRKVTAQANTNQTVKDVASPLLKRNMSLWLAGMGTIGSVGYAAYEWRRDILNRLGRWRTKFFS